ncbi:MAG: hypothetical protein CL927_05575, partial [Deltaproteobacteria bacterium]|nr:hypothetical protein [Deltaproteobacteria bacterium]
MLSLSSFRFSRITAARAPLYILWVAWTAFIVSASAPASAADSSCTNPQESARSLLDNLMSDSWQPERAWQCLDLPPGTNTAEAINIAKQLKLLLDARGHYVPVASLSLDPSFQNEQGGHRVQPVASFPELVIERAENGQWLWSRSLVQATPDLYEDAFS